MMDIDIDTDIGVDIEIGSVSLENPNTALENIL